MARLTIRIDVSDRGAIGPGKIQLLELVGESGSICAAGRAMNMSYRRAWTLIDELYRCFRGPVFTTQLGGAGRGGASPLSAMTRSRGTGASKRRPRPRPPNWLPSGLAAR